MIITIIATSFPIPFTSFQISGFINSIKNAVPRQEKVGKAIDLSPKTRKEREREREKVKQNSAGSPSGRLSKQGGKRNHQKLSGGSALEFHLPLPIQALAFLDNDLLHFHDALAAQLFHFGFQRAGGVEGCHVVAASYRFAVDQDVGDCFAAGGFLEGGLQAGAEGVEV